MIPTQAKWLFGILFLCVMTFGAIALVSVMATNDLGDQVAELQADVVSFNPNPVKIGEVTRQTARISIGNTCFAKDSKEIVTISSETWSFGGTEIPEGFDGIYRAPVTTFTYGGTNGLPLDEDNCFNFNGFPQPMPARLQLHLSQNPDVEVTVGFRILVESTDVTDPTNPIKGRPVVLLSDPITVPAQD